MWEHQTEKALNVYLDLDRLCVDIKENGGCDRGYSEETTVRSRLYDLMEEMRLSQNRGDNIPIERSAILISFVICIFTPALIGQTVLSKVINRTCSIPASCDSTCGYTFGC